MKRKSKKADALTHTEKVFKKIAEYYATHRRDFPWRPPSLRSRKDGSIDAYKILVSELMLQQTQVSRVVPKYSAFIKRFPSARSLASARLVEVLTLWQGLGYNRRAKFLHQTAIELESVHRGRMPASFETLRTLPGVGEYTASAVCVFAFNAPRVLIETNIRTVLFHHFFTQEKYKKEEGSGLPRVHDRELIPLLDELWECALRAGFSPREWNYALMDYGAHLKASRVRVTNQSAHYKKQSRFKGSDREIRGALLKHFLETPTNAQALVRAVAKLLNTPEARVREQYQVLKNEGML